MNTTNNDVELNDETLDQVTGGEEKKPKEAPKPDPYLKVVLVDVLISSW